ncbi:MAG: response regulator [Candidatus Eisenbacteria bacterium]|nr:response regulator [Candidatus Eisenbacteria bacterium]
MPQKRPAKKVVIVEDQSATAWALAESLTEDGYETLTAGSSEEALELDLEHCDVLITDLRLPGMNGIELMSRMKRTRRAVPSILITAYSSPDVLASAKRAGAIGCFSKPFNVEDIKECLKKALKGPRRKQAGRRRNLSSAPGRVKGA